MSTFKIDEDMLTEEDIKQNNNSSLITFVTPRLTMQNIRSYKNLYKTFKGGANSVWNQTRVFSNMTMPDDWDEKMQLVMAMIAIRKSNCVLLDISDIAKNKNVEKIITLIKAYNTPTMVIMKSGTKIPEKEKANIFQISTKDPLQYQSSIDDCPNIYGEVFSFAKGFSYKTEEDHKTL